ncbi:MAG: AAA family ATPase [Acidobacteriota bacterium]
MTMIAPPLPAWADEMRRLFVSGAASQFLLHGNVLDLVPTMTADGLVRDMPLRQFLEDVLLGPFDVVLVYDRGRGLRVRRGQDLFHQWLKVFDSFQGTDFSTLPARDEQDPGKALDRPGLLPREPRRALELADRFIRGGLHRTKVDEKGSRVPDPVRTAIVVDHAQYLVPQADAIYLAGEPAEHLIRVLDWATDPTIAVSPVVTCLIAPNLHDLNRQVVENPYTAKIAVPLPDASAVGEFLERALGSIPGGRERCELSPALMGPKLVGLSRANIRSLLQRTVGAGGELSFRELSRIKKDLIEKECQGLLGFIESTRNLDSVAGHTVAKAWLREDAALLKQGALDALPMGYLVTGRIGTGKTFLVECWAGEIGVPMVELRNFRDKWVGATEGNLETIFRVLKALGQVVVFVDEADQATGRRGGGEGDSGLSGRVYSMLAQEMSDTRNRGRIVWVFATSRPDLLEVDLKRQGRLDVHIPLFPPQDADGRRELFLAMAKKLKLPLTPEDLPPQVAEFEIGGNEMEGLLVRAGRQVAIARARGEEVRPMREIVAEVFAEFRPSAHQTRLELMDLLAVEECTDTRFLPPKFRDVPLHKIRRRRAELETV